MPSFEKINQRLTSASLQLAPIDEWEEQLPEAWESAVDEFEERYSLDVNPDLEHERRLDSRNARIIYTLDLPKGFRDLFSDNPVEVVLSLDEVDRKGDEAVFVVESDGAIDNNFLGYILSESPYFEDFLGKEDGSLLWSFHIPAEDVEARLEDEGDYGDHTRLEEFLKDPEAYYVNQIPNGELYVESIGEEGSTIAELKEEYPEKLPGKVSIRSGLNDLVRAGILEKEKRGQENVYLKL